MTSKTAALSKSLKSFNLLKSTGGHILVSHDNNIFHTLRVVITMTITDSYGTT